MQLRPDNPVIVQGDGKVLVETQHPRYEEVHRCCRLQARLSYFTPHHTAFLWNAASAGLKKEGLIEGLRGWSKFDVPPDVLETISDTIERYGLVKLVPHPKDQDLLRLEFASGYVAKLVSKEPTLTELLVADGRRAWGIHPGHRGIFKQRALQAGWPVEDLAGFRAGSPLEIELADHMEGNGKPFSPRPYQWEAARKWWQTVVPAAAVASWCWPVVPERPSLR